MKLEQKLKTLQMYYAAALADSTLRYGSEDICPSLFVQTRIASRICAENERKCHFPG
jgi:hypothetical protein